MSKPLRLVNDCGSKRRWNEQVARSEAECQRRNNVQDERLNNTMIGAEGGAVASSPSFLVLSMDNVNSQNQKAIDLLNRIYFATFYALR